MLTRTRSLDAITTIDLHGRLGVEDGGALPEAVREFLNVGRREVVLSRLRAPVERRLVTLTGVPVPTENSIGLTRSLSSGCFQGRRRRVWTFLRAELTRLTLNGLKVNRQLLR